MKKNTKRTLVATLLVMLLSLTVLIGSTYAYFNDLVQTNGSVSTGELNTKLYYAFTEVVPTLDSEWTEADDNAYSSNVVDGEGFTFSLEEYKPGDYTNLWFKFVNTATLKYTLSFTFTATEDAGNGAIKLLSQFAYKITTFKTTDTVEVDELVNDITNANFYEGENLPTGEYYEIGENIDEGDVVYVCFQIRMLDSNVAQNEYQNKSADFTFNFDARQLAGEFVAPNTNADR